jgi:hypothetical protein
MVEAARTSARALRQGLPVRPLLRGMATSGVHGNRCALVRVTVWSGSTRGGRMFKGFAVAGVVLLAAGCGSGGSPAVPPTVTVTATPSVTLDAKGREACELAARDAWLVALADAKLSLVTELQDVALREEQLGNHELIKAWCAQHYHGGSAPWNAESPADGRALVLGEVTVHVS